MRIRPITPADRAGLWSIVEPIVRAGETWALDRDMSEEAGWAYWTAPDREAFVAEEDGKLLGAYFLRANYAGGGAHVANTGYMVAQAAGGRGVGRALCQHSMDTAKARGFRAMQFNFVVSTNAPAMHLWQSMGFTIIGRVPGGFRHPVLGDVDSVMMFREL